MKTYLIRCAMRTSCEILFGAALLLVGSVGYARNRGSVYEVGTWPGFRQAAVSYTFDDGCSNQFAIARRLRATATRD